MSNNKKVSARIESASHQWRGAEHVGKVRLEHIGQGDQGGVSQATACAHTTAQPGHVHLLADAFS